MAEDAGRELTLTEVARRLGVHYMTAYRYVRTGRLAGRKEPGGEWRVAATELDALGRRDVAPSDRRGPLRWSRHVERLVDRLVVGDEAGAWQLVERALVGGATPAEVYTRIVGPGLRRIGDEWADGRLTVIDEHRAATVATRIVGRLGPMFSRPGRRRGTVVVGGAPGDHHALPVAMLADVLRGEGFAVVDLGPATPAESFASVGENDGELLAVGLSAATDASLDEAIGVIETLRSRRDPLPILLGGPAVRDEEAARRAGADGWAPDAAAAATVLEEVAPRRSEPAARARRAEQREH
jgi:excisionase family DNA binding protein